MMKNVFVKILGTEKKRSSQKKKCAPSTMVITSSQTIPAPSSPRVHDLNHNSSRIPSHRFCLSTRYGTLTFSAEGLEISVWPFHLKFETARSEKSSVDSSRRNREDFFHFLIPAEQGFFFFSLASLQISPLFKSSAPGSLASKLIPGFSSEDLLKIFH
ncbi:hypothetical protein PoB_003735400 [Plakobranchus ocellatus]|uniref:Uncharacterized protein n=1 Tax=Plakobranchus ocellatus TaxID=259542 RepID=A0AAV4ASQ8_9GAST|nr:hypothetical protein PoB_003735400 [Plakobranchus ocellatus]